MTAVLILKLGAPLPGGGYPLSVPLLIPKGSQPIAGRLRTSGTTPPVLCFSGRILEGSQASASDEPYGGRDGQSTTIRQQLMIPVRHFSQIHCHLNLAVFTMPTKSETAKADDNGSGKIPLRGRNWIR